MQLARLGAGEFFLGVRNLVDAGQIELTNCPVHHPVIPLVSGEMVMRQLSRNSQVMRDTLGVEPSKGIFMPELAADEASLRLVSEMVGEGLEYVVVDESALGGEYKAGVSWNNTKLTVNKRSVCEVLRSFPDRMTAENFLRWMESQSGEGQTLVSANDAELFGHHYEERGGLLDGILASDKWEFVKLSEVSSGKLEGVSEIAASTWQAGVMGGKPFDLWANEANDLQLRYLELGGIANTAFEEAKGKMGGHELESATEHLDQGWSSCHLYWLSNRPWWHPDLVVKGAENLIKAVRSVPGGNKIKMRAEEVFHDLTKKIWLYHWSGEVERKYQEYEKQRVEWLKDLPKI